ncbi:MULTISPECIES: phosphate ABC transporter substrate-binding protein [unclassified Streptomyces]|uniref:phosphate ABC transporter substrate-binding protein n=1 Tax=unclassified Streptomyces TaxID=2593676 RepID=UPI002365944B|nr:MULTISPECIES: phosphate ABC transporter substrate-binding protein [unclassified Streptomyces]MDF3139958.1 phosphate ABC transporter substrate-binding protein [Streptomyces sp. T21Q-yed]WDF39902.1 phosphate ABC transporter substrate-binding protein [Streptomyces sp. T12]
MSVVIAQPRHASSLLAGKRTQRGVAAASALLFGALLTGCAGSAKADSSTALQASGSTTVAPVASDAAEALKSKGLKITVATQGGSSGGISQLGSGQIEVALSSKPISDEDRKAYPKTDFVPTQIGADAVGIIVTKEVADGGVKSLTKAQVRGLFEGKVTNWKQVGGPDLDVFVYDKEPGRGTREVLDKFIYGEEGKAPAPPQSDNYAIVGGNLETRNKLESTPGSVGPLSTGFIEGHDDLVAVALEGVEPTEENVASGKYAMTRPLFMITDGKPQGAAEKYIDYVLSPAGQKLLPAHGYLTREQMGL